MQMHCMLKFRQQTKAAKAGGHKAKEEEVNFIPSANRMGSPDVPRDVSILVKHMSTKYSSCLSSIDTQR